MYLAPAGAWARLRFGCLRKPPKTPLHLLSHAHAHTCTSHGMHGMAAHLNHEAHRRSALRRAAMRSVSPALPRARLLLTRARAYCWRGIATNSLASMALHVLCMCCACAVLCCAMLCMCMCCAVHVHVHPLCMRCACAMYVL